MSSRAKAKQANRMVREQLAKEARRRRTVIVSIVAAAVLVIAGLVGWGVYASQRPAGYNTPAHASSDHTGIVVSSGSTTVDIYLDYLCPICQHFEQTAQSTLDQLAAQKKILLTYHPIAILDERTNPTGYSTRAGAAAGCAADGGKFLEYTKALYAQQPAEGSAGLTNDQLIQIGTSVGLIAPGFAQCVRNATYGSWMAHNTDDAAGHNINATPTVFVNGKQVEATVDAVKAAVGG